MSIDFKALRNVLATAVLADVLDRMGHRQQVLRPFVRPVDDSRVLFGHARTGRFEPADAPDPNGRPYERLIGLVDDLRLHDVIVLACDGPTETLAPWGELLSTAAKARGAAGCLTDGRLRDARQVRQLGFTVFHGGHGPLDSDGRGRLVETDRPVTCAGVQVMPGDLVFGDVDGVIVVPQDLASDAIANALDKIQAETTTRSELEDGRPLAEVFARHRVL